MLQPIPSKPLIGIQLRSCHGGPPYNGVLADDYRLEKTTLILGAAAGVSERWIPPTPLRKRLGAPL